MLLKLNNNGMTLVEILAAIGIFLLLFVGMAALLVYSFKSNKIIWEQLSTQNEGRKVIQDFVNELRSATASSIGAYCLATASTTQIVFYSNIDTDTLRERIRYYLSGTTLKKGVLKPSGSPLAYNPANEAIIDLVHDVANGTTSLFYYYDENYTGASTNTPMTHPVNTSNVRVVGIKLLLEEDPSASPAPFSIESKAVIRNLKTN
jgi:type II secretory pathway pseudopilin PulG